MYVKIKPNLNKNNGLSYYANLALEKIMKNYTIKQLALLGLTIGLVIAGASYALINSSLDKNTPTIAEAPSKTATNTVASADTNTADDGNILPTISVYKSPSCGCCSKWVTHLEENGFKVVSHNVDNLNPIKEKAKLFPGATSCHTAFVGDYAVEGHVPANDIKRLLSEKPDIDGLTVPGMPMGSPGMEVASGEVDPYDVVSYKDGKTVGAFSSHK